VRVWACQQANTKACCRAIRRYKVAACYRSCGALSLARVFFTRDYLVFHFRSQASVCDVFIKNKGKRFLLSQKRLLAIDWF